jgi:hypothetical protein
MLDVFAVRSDNEQAISAQIANSRQSFVTRFMARDIYMNSKGG